MLFIYNILASSFYHAMNVRNLNNLWINKEKVSQKKSSFLVLKKHFNLSNFSSCALVVYFRSFPFDIMPCGLNLFLEVAFNYETFQSFTCFTAFMRWPFYFYFSAKKFFLTRIHVAREQAQKSGYAILNVDFLPFRCVRL